MEQQRNIDKRRLADKLMDAFGVKNRRVVWTFLKHCTDEQDMEDSLRTLRRQDTRTGWFW